MKEISSAVAKQCRNFSRERQPLVLRPAYNPNVASGQASTERFFQQIQAMSQARAFYLPFECIYDPKT